MTWILCDVTECRYNDHERCALSEIRVSPGSVGVVPEILEPTANLSPESLLAGYADEFDAYAEYAQAHPDAMAQGALCRSYTPS